MITFLNEDIFDVECEALVNPVNTIGVMGKGLALVFKNRYPRNFEYYKSQCQLGLFKIGSILTYKEDEILILNFPTKKHWRDPSKLLYIEKGLLALKEEILFHDIKTINIPALGAGLGGLSWDEVKLTLINHLSDLNCDIRIFNPL